jgi:hypothetical protein
MANEESWNNLLVKHFRIRISTGSFDAGFGILSIEALIFSVIAFTMDIPHYCLHIEEFF